MKIFVFIERNCQNHNISALFPLIPFNFISLNIWINKDDKIQDHRFESLYGSKMIDISLLINSNEAGYSLLNNKFSIDIKVMFGLGIYR